MLWVIIKDCGGFSVTTDVLVKMYFLQDVPLHQSSKRQRGLCYARGQKLSQIIPLRRTAVFTNIYPYLQIQVRGYRLFLLLHKWKGVNYLGWAKDLEKDSGILEETWKQNPNESGRPPPRPSAASLPWFSCIPQLQKFSTLPAVTLYMGAWKLNTYFSDDARWLPIGINLLMQWRNKTYMNPHLQLFLTPVFGC